MGFIESWLHQSQPTNPGEKDAKLMFHSILFSKEKPLFPSPSKEKKKKQ
jgi:hypothetical protein